jgi:DNA-binding CsgD family transcriptional regulator
MATANPLPGRGSECDALRHALEAARSGHSAVLVLRGEPGIGKTALIEYARTHATAFRTLSIAGVEAEMELPFAAVQQICAPFLSRIDQLAPPQRDALNTALGNQSGPPPDRFLVGLAVLTLIAEVASERPLLLIADDAQWLDHTSSQVLSFVARRLHAEPVFILFATRAEYGDVLHGLPEIVLKGLDPFTAGALLDATVRTPLDEQVRSRLISEAHGNPLALLELPRVLRTEFSTDDRSRTAPITQQIESEFVRRIEELPAQTQKLLLLAANEPVGDPTLLWRAAAELGVNVDAALPAEAAGLLYIRSRVQFRHPLIRSAIRRAASLGENREAHAALAQASTLESDPDRRAWHRALAAAAPDESIAAELERSADRAGQRGGVAAKAAFLTQAASLTPAAHRRSQRALRAAQAQLTAGALDTCHELVAMIDHRALADNDVARLGLLEAQLAFAARRGQDAAPLLLTAAQRLETVEPTLARQTYLDTISAAMFAGRFSDNVDVEAAGRAARVALGDGPVSGLQDELLACLATRFSDGHKTAAPKIRVMLAHLRMREIEPRDLRYLWLAAACAVDVWADEDWEEVAAGHVRVARSLGALGELPLALNSHAVAHVFAGNLSTAATLIAEAASVIENVGTELAPYGAMALQAWRGDVPDTTRSLDRTRVAAAARGEGIGVSVSYWAEAVLALGQSRFRDALVAARSAVPAATELTVPKWALADLIEAAVRTDDVPTAAAAFERLSEMTGSAGSDWAYGVEARARALLSPQPEALYREAVDRLSRTRMRTELARAHLLHGEWLLRVSRTSEARDALQQAYELFDRVGAAAFAARASGGVRASGASVRPSAASATVALTEQEMQIAQLARSGQTNAEIAAQLFLSPHTIEWHLRKVYSKLGVRGRKQLAGRLAEPSDPATA